MVVNVQFVVCVGWVMNKYVDFVSGIDWLDNVLVVVVIEFIVVKVGV